LTDFKIGENHPSAEIKITESNGDFTNLTRSSEIAISALLFLHICSENK